MADFQRVIEFLRDVRQGAGSGGLQSVSEEVAHMAAEYATLCAAANDRLRQCTSFLQQGLRTEAIHLAEESPNLLDLVSQLDLPDPQAWAEFCQNNSLPVPPALQLERAAQLNEAYAQDQPLEHLLARHRLLALSRAPIRERLDVMRKIAALDPANANWEKDLRLFERARLKELPASFYNAVKNHDNHAINGLLEELSEPWFETPPADLVQAVTDAHGRVPRAGVEVELRKLVEPLREAFAARSLQECQALVQRWKNAMANAGVTHVAGDLMDEIKPVVAFIAEQTKRDDYLKRFHDSCKTFAKMLDADVADSQLEAGYAKLREFKEDIPEDLTRRYMNKRSGRRKDADRRHKLRLATIAGLFAFLIVIGVVVAFMLSHASAADKWAQRINDAVALHTKEGLVQAQAMVDQLKSENPGLAAEPKVASAMKALEVAESRYSIDAGNVQAAIAKVERARQAASLVAANPSASMEEIRAAAANLDAVINEAGDLLKAAKWADSENKLSGAIQGAQSIRNNMQTRVIDAARAELGAVAAELQQVPADTSTPAAVMAAQNQLSILAERGGKLVNLPLLDAPTKSAIDALNKRIAQRRQGADAAGGVAEELQNIRGMGGSAAELRTALTHFVGRFPADPRAADFKTALTRLPAADSLDAWQAKIATYQGQFIPTGAADAQKKLDDVSAFLAAHSDCPLGAPAAQYADYLRRAADALADKGPWQTALTPVATNPFISELDFIEVSDGRKFFVLGDPKRTEHKINNVITSVSFEALDLKTDDGGNYHLYKEAPTATSASTAPATQVPNTVTITIEAPLHVPDTAIPTPQKKAAAEIVASLKLIDGGNWDTYGIDWADRIAHNDPMDPVVKAILLQQILKTQVAVAGPLIGDAYDKTVAAITRLQPETLPWPDPSKISDATRKTIKQIIDDMPTAQAVRQHLDNAKAALFKSLTSFLPSGVLLKDDAGTWTVFTRTRPTPGLIVWAIGPAPAGAPAPAPPPATDTAPAAPAAPTLPPTTLVQIGVATVDRFVLDESALKNIPQGTMVFITKQNP